MHNLFTRRRHILLTSYIFFLSLENASHKILSIKKKESNGQNVIVESFFRVKTLFSVRWFIGSFVRFGFLLGSPSPSVSVALSLIYGGKFSIQKNSISIREENQFVNFDHVTCRIWLFAFVALDILGSLACPPACVNDHSRLYMCYDVVHHFWVCIHSLWLWMMNKICVLNEKKKKR